MTKIFYFPIKGTFYYDANLAFKTGELRLNTSLKLQAEPNNIYDPYAIQIWLKTSSKLLGYIPKPLAKNLTPYIDFSSLHLSSVKKKGQYLSLTAEIEINCTYLQGIQIFWISTYLYWHNRIKSWLFFGKKS